MSKYSLLISWISAGIFLAAAHFVVPAFAAPTDCAHSVLSVNETISTFRGLLPKIQSFSIGDVIYNRPARPDRPDSGASGSVYAQLDSSRHSLRALRLMLKDSDPRMRTLAIAALCRREDKSSLPDLAAMVDDNSRTFPEPMAVAMTLPGGNIPLSEKTVGAVAQQVLRMYMEPAGYHYGVKGSGTEPGFARYWQEHKDRKFCASWFLIKLARASGGCSPTDRARLPAIKAVRAQLDSVPQPHRDWILLWLGNNPGYDALASPEDILLALKRLGPAALMAMLQGDIPCDDPDLQSRRNNNYSYQCMQLVVLKRARLVLRPQQWPDLLSCGMQERDYQKDNRSDPLISPWWAIAAAQLNRAQARTILLNEFKHLDHDFYGFQKADLAAALFEECGLQEKTFLVNCFYDPQSFGREKQYSQFRPLWLHALSKSADTFVLVRLIVNDSRFETLNDAAALRALSEAAVSCGRAGIPSAQLERAWHPLGLERACLNFDHAREQYPRETDDLLKELASWRKSLRSSFN